MERLTIFVKGTFTLHPGGTAELSPPLELVREDRHRDGWGSLEEAAETAPYLPSAGVIARGHACAPGGSAVTVMRVRLALFQPPRWTLSKVLHVFGDRTRSAPSPQAFRQMPIIYERAYGARNMEANPVGQGSGEMLPNIVDSADPARPAGFGPIAKQWAPRKHFGAGSPRLEGGAEEINPALDFRYFHAAPADQQIDYLRGDEWIYLEGLHPRFPWLSSSLPSARGAARLYRTGRTGAQEQGELVDLVADMLVIDADRLICSIVWRGNVALRPGDTLARMRVLAGVELPGRPIPWPTTEAPNPAAINPVAINLAAVNPVAKEEPISGETVKLPSGALAAILRKPIAPFALAEPAPKAPSSAIPGAPWSSGQAIHVSPPPPLDAESNEETLKLPAATNRKKRDLGSETAPTGTGLVVSRGLPFTPVEAPAPRSEPASALIPSGLPFAPTKPSAPRSEPPPAPITTGLPVTPTEYIPPKPELVAPVAPPALVEPPAAEPPAPPPLFVLGKAPEPAEPAPPVNAASSIPPPPPVNAASSIPPPPPVNAASSIPPPPPVNAASSIPPPPPAGAPPDEANEKDLRARVIARLKRGEALHDLELAGAELAGVDFSGALLERRSFSGSNLARCNFTGAKLTGADMRGADLTESLLVDADLTGAILSRATLDRARLHGAILNNADLSLAKGSRASFEGASLQGVNLRQARLPEGVFNSADLSGVNAGKADLSLSSLIKANLRGASLRDAKLKQATLAGANVDRADMRDADLTGSNVHGVNLADAKTNGAILRDVIEEPPPE